MNRRWPGNPDHADKVLDSSLDGLIRNNRPSLTGPPDDSQQKAITRVNGFFIITTFVTLVLVISRLQHSPPTGSDHDFWKKARAIGDIMQPLILRNYIGSNTALKCYVQVERNNFRKSKLLQCPATMQTLVMESPNWHVCRLIKVIEDKFLGANQPCLP